MTIRIAPPRPAPYLDGAPSLSDELLARVASRQEIAPLIEAAIQTQLESVTQQIRRRREAYEALHGLRIIPERPVAE